MSENRAHGSLPSALWRRACNMLDRIERRWGVFAAGLLAAVVAESLSFAFASSWYTDEIYVSRFTGLSQDPFRVGELPIPYPEHRLRLLGPVIAWALGLRGIAGTLVPVLASLPLLGLVYVFVRRRCSVQMGLVSTLLLATTHLTMTSRTLLGYQDSLVFLCCVAALMVRRPALRGAMLFLAMFGDVRAVLVVPFLLIWPGAQDDALPPLGEMARRAMACAVAVAAWIAGANLLLHLLGYEEMSSIRLTMYLRGDFLKDIVPAAIPLSGFMTFKAAWLFALAGVAWMYQRHWLLGIYVTAVLLAIAGSSLLVHDFSRALAFCFPVILLGLAGSWRRDPHTCIIAAGTCLMVNLLSPFFQGLTSGLWVISYPLPLELARLIIP